MTGEKHVVVIGAGVVGATVAVQLLTEGHRVTLLDPDSPGGPQAASHGNGAFLSPASIIPMSAPGLWRKVPGYLLDPAGPLTIRLRHLPCLAPWLWRFLMAGRSADRVEATAVALSALLADAPGRHQALAARIGRPDLIRRNGLVYAFRDRAAYETEALSWGLRRKLGVRMEEMDEVALRALLPDLSPAYRFAIRLPDGGNCTDPGGYVAAITNWAEGQGALLRRDRATGFDLAQGRLVAVRCVGGAIACDAAVIACGIHSRPLACALGDAVPLESERGYFVEIPAPSVRPAVPVMPQDGRMANVVTSGGLRASGQVELASVRAAPDWRRADILLGHLQNTWPGLAFDPGQVRRWMGHRPSTPDGRPVIGPARACGDVIHAFGHGHIGLASAPMTAEAVADLLAGRPPRLPPGPFAPGRFRRAG